MNATSALRHALRLIHCLQRERGASCALAGARAAVKQKSNEGSEQLQCFSRYLQNVRLARASANSAMRPIFYLGGNNHESSSGVTSKLLSIRQFVDGEPSATKETNEKYWFVHNVVKDYSSLLSFVIKVYVVDTITARMEAVISHKGSGKGEKAALLKLLLSFVELKESLGFERATLTGIMVIGNTTIHESDKNDETNDNGLPIIINDVVMVVETQHRILSELQKQSRFILKPETALETEEHVHATSLDHNLLRLVGESTKQSDEMRSLQEHIRKDFDVNGFHEVI
jgi:hypothetical protein